MRDKFGRFTIRHMVPIEMRKKISESNKGKKLSKEHIEKIKLSNIGRKMSKEAKEKIKLANIGKKLSLETKQKKSNKMKIKWAKDKEYRKRMSVSHIGKKQSKETIKKRIKQGKDHYNWQGGISKEKRGLDWTEPLKRSIRERDRYTCQICSKQQENRAHAVHHIDYNKKNNDPNNLISLCLECHIKTNYNRNEWKEYFKNRSIKWA